MNILIKLINDVKALCNTIITAVNAIKVKTDAITANLFTATHASRIDANISSRQASWGATSTHASRIDASISSRATNDGIWAYTGNKSLSVMKPSSTAVLTLAGPITVPSSAYKQLIAKIKTGSVGGNYKITFFTKLYSGSVAAMDFVLTFNINGILTTYAPSGGTVNGTGTTLTIASAYFPSSSEISITMDGKGSTVTITNIVISGSPSNDLLYL